MRNPTAADMIRALKLKPHPEGGHYRETFRDTHQLGGRPASTAILFLLGRGERSHWHRIDAVEIWHYCGGAPLKLEVIDGAKEEIFRLGADIHAGEVPQVMVPARAWQAAEKLFGIPEMDTDSLAQVIDSTFGGPLEWAILGC